MLDNFIYQPPSPPPPAASESVTDGEINRSTALGLMLNVAKNVATVLGAVQQVNEEEKNEITSHSTSGPELLHSG